MHIFNFCPTSLVLFLLGLVPLCNSGVLRPSTTENEPETLGLYKSSDKVFILDNDNFKSSVVEQNYACLIEFYNSYCGHCKRFAPVYKELGESTYEWRDVIKVMAVDCADEKNNDICREYEVMAYPTVRYFGVNYKPSEGNYGTPVEARQPDEMRQAMARLVMGEPSTHKNWPNFADLTPSESKTLFQSVPDTVKFVLLVLSPSNAENTTATGAQTILNFNRSPELLIRRVTDSKLAEHFNLNSTYALAAVDRNANVELLPHGDDNTASDYAKAIEKFVQRYKLSTRPTDQNEPNEVAAAPRSQGDDKEKHRKIIDEVKRNRHLVYQADLEQAIKHIITTEIVRSKEISGERLLALQNLISVLQRYSPLGPNGMQLLKSLLTYVSENHERIIADDLKKHIAQLSSELDPIFSSSGYVGCLGSTDMHRGFTCSLWHLFHFLTVQASNSNQSQDPLEVLTAMHGFVKYFFGCTDCSEHFQEMAKQRNIWSVPTKDEAVLWLWEAHNVVNKRLSGDATEDPIFPKIQFPSTESCRQCQVNGSTSDPKATTTWNRSAVLSFLKNINNPNYISRFGLENPEILYGSIEKIRQKRMVGNVFSDMDMRMGMLLYGFCIGMMIVAFKLFAVKGYRKKAYTHGFLGKV